MIKISTSILSSNNRIECTQKLNETTNDYLHIDVMDGIFVPNTQFTIAEINNLKNISKSKADIHLMVEDPNLYIDKIENKNINNITFHLEVNQNIDNIINKIKSLNCKVGIAIKPKTDINRIVPYLDKIDTVLVMSVEPGFGGQKFIPESLNRLKKIKELKPTITVEVDGGVNNENIKEIKKYADIAVVGVYITNSNNYQEAINNLKN